MLQEIATAIKAKITFEEIEVDLWDELPEHVKRVFLKAKRNSSNGNFMHEEIMAKYKTKYNL